MGLRIKSIKFFSELFLIIYTYNNLLVIQQIQEIYTCFFDSMKTLQPNQLNDSSEDSNQFTYKIAEMFGQNLKLSNQKIIELSEANNVISSENVELKQIIKQLFQKSITLEGKLAIRTYEKQLLEKNNQAFQIQNSELKQRVDTTQNSNQSYQAKTEKELKKQKVQVLKCQMKIEQLSFKNQLQRTKIKQKTKQLLCKSKVIETLKKKNQSKDNKIFTVNAENQYLRAQIEQLKQNNSQLKQNSVQLKQNSSQLTDRNQTLATAIEDNINKIAQLDLKINKLELQNRNLTEKLNSCQESIKQAKKIQYKLKKIVQSLKNQPSFNQQINNFKQQTTNWKVLQKNVYLLDKFVEQVIKKQKRQIQDRSTRQSVIQFIDQDVTQSTNLDKLEKYIESQQKKLEKINDTQQRQLCQQQIKTFKQKLNDKRTIIQLSKQKDKLTKQLSDKINQIEANKEALTKMTNNYQTQKLNYSNYKKQIAIQIEKLNRSKQQLQKQSQNKDQKIKQKDKDIQESVQNIEKLVQDITIIMQNHKAQIQKKETQKINALIKAQKQAEAAKTTALVQAKKNYLIKVEQTKNSMRSTLKQLEDHYKAQIQNIKKSNSQNQSDRINKMKSNYNQEIKEKLLKIQFLQHQLQVNQGQCKQIKRDLQLKEKQCQRLRKDNDDFSERIKKLSSSTVPFLSQSNIFDFYQDKDQISFIRDSISKFMGKKVIGSRTVFRKSEELNFHRFMDRIPKLLLIIHLKNGQKIGGFTENPFIPKLPQRIKGRGFLFSASNRKCYYQKSDDKSYSIVYDSYYIIWGNSEIRVRRNEQKVDSNFDTIKGFYDPKGDRVHNFLAEGLNQRQAPFVALQFLEVRLQGQQFSNNEWCQKQEAEERRF